MTIQNYGQLKTAIGDWSTRPDLSGFFPDYITMVESVFNYGEGEPGDAGYIAPLRCRQMEATATVTVTSSLGPLPSDYLETRRVQSTDSPPNTMTYVTPEWYSDAYPSGDTSDFLFYSILGSNIIAGENVTFDYYQQIPTIVGTGSGDSATNWLLTAAPNAYLFGSLYYLTIFNKNQGGGQDGAVDKSAAYRAMFMSASGGFRRTAALQRADRPTMRSSMTAF